jgi:hypothetical protein
MKKLFYSGLIIFVALLIEACSSGKAALQRGQYEQAVLQAVNRLRSSPTNQNAIATLREGYPLALNWHQSKIGQLQASQEKFRWEQILQSYQTLNQLSDEILRCPACLNYVSNPPSFLNEMNNARNLAATARYEAGDELMKASYRDRMTAREALRHFQTAENLVPNYKDVRERMAEARFFATLKVVVEQLPVQSKMYSLSDEFFRNQVYQYISTNPRMNEFVRFYTPDEAMSQKLEQPDHVVRLQFDDFVVGETFMNTNTEVVTSKDSVKVGETKVDGKKIDVYDKVTAKLITNRKTVTSKGLLDMQIYSPSLNKVIFQDKMVGEFVWFSEWSSFNGDERALTKAQRELCNRREVPPPPPQELFVQFCKPLFNQATQKIKDYYRNF